jgi:hypothetical protein
MAPRPVVHLGFHKTATTWFQRVALGAHPGLAAHRHGPSRDDPLLQAWILDADRDFDAKRARQAYETRLAELPRADPEAVVISEERLSGHAITGGYDTLRIAERIASTLPDALVWFVVREQVDMIESEYLQLVQEGTPARLRELLDFRPRLATVPGFDLGHYEYDRLADRYVELFGAERVRVFEFSSVIADPQKFLDDLAAFMGVTPWPRLPDAQLHRRVNPTLPRRLLGVRRAMNHFERRALNPYPVLALPPFWRGPLWWLASHLPDRRRPLIDTETAARLRVRYEPANVRLAARHGVRFRSPKGRR